MAKRVGGRGSAPDPDGGAYDASPDTLVGWGGDTPPHTLPPQRLRRFDTRRLRRLEFRAFGAQFGRSLSC